MNIFRHPPGYPAALSPTPEPVQHHTAPPPPLQVAVRAARVAALADALAAGSEAALAALDRVEQVEQRAAAAREHFLTELARTKEGTA